jgi:large subunit ribosomal protein L5e
MGFVKVLKNKAYYKRYQVKFRRRREGKTDYYARKRLIFQAKNKYNAPKYRFVVRITNRKVMCQLAYSKIEGDRVIAHAYSNELPKYGVSQGLTNYAACYCTGLLLARRQLTKLGLADSFVGNTAVGEKYQQQPSAEGRRPFKALLDIGLVRTTTGARVFAAMKGASDGGLNVPHNGKRFFGSKGEKVDQDALRGRIMGAHVADWMRALQERADGSYEKVFSRYVKASVGPDDLEGLYTMAHAAIRADRVHVSTGKAKPEGFVQKRFNRAKLHATQRDQRIRQILGDKYVETYVPPSKKY